MVDCEITYRLERGTNHSLSGCGNLFETFLLKTVRLSVIRNESKWTIFASGELRLYQSYTLCGVSMRTLAPKGSGLWDHISVGERNEAFLIRVWKSPQNILLKTMRLTTIRNKSKQAISASGELRLYQSYTLCGVSTRTLASKESGLWDPISIGVGNETFLIKSENLFETFFKKPWDWQ